jgi:formate dehydrogenase subunit delta
MTSSPPPIRRNGTLACHHCVAHQIGKFLTAQDTATASAQIAEPVTKVWGPRIRKAIIAHLDAGGPGLDPAPRQAVTALPALTNSS